MSFPDARLTYLNATQHVEQAPITLFILGVWQVDLTKPIGGCSHFFVWRRFTLDTLS